MKQSDPIRFFTRQLAKSWPLGLAAGLVLGHSQALFRAALAAWAVPALGLTLMAFWPWGRKKTEEEEPDIWEEPEEADGPGFFELPPVPAAPVPPAVQTNKNPYSSHTADLLNGGQVRVQSGAAPLDLSAQQAAMEVLGLPRFHRDGVLRTLRTERAGAPRFLELLRARGLVAFFTDDAFYGKVSGALADCAAAAGLPPVPPELLRGDPAFLGTSAAADLARRLPDWRVFLILDPAGNLLYDSFYLGAVSPEKADALKESMSVCLDGAYSLVLLPTGEE